MIRSDQLANVRACTTSDESFLYDVFATTWESEVAALPNQNLAQHVLRIQHIAQERRFASHYPGYQRFVVLADGSPAGRLYLHERGPTLQIVDLTLLPELRDRGIGTAVFRGLFELATQEGRTLTMRVSRRNRRATDLAASLGFHLVTVDDLDHYLEWTPAETPVGDEQPLGAANPSKAADVS